METPSEQGPERDRGADTVDRPAGDPPRPGGDADDTTETIPLQEVAAAAPPGAQEDEPSSEEVTAEVPTPSAEELAGAPHQPLIAVRDLVKHYGEIRAVDSIGFEVRRGDVLAFLGPNGAGKTTAMKMITGFLEPDAGVATVCGFDVSRHPLEVRRRIGYLPENAPSYGDMTVRSFLDFVAEARGLEDRDAAVDRVMATTGLRSVAGQVIETLSKGFKRRVGLAQALIHDPDVLILDEPTDGLDPNQKELVHQLIESLASTKSILISTHILDEAERICNRVVILSQGRILVDSTPAELVERAPGHNVVVVTFEGDVPEGVLGRLRQRSWCESAAMLEDGRLEIRPRDGENRLAEVLAAVEDHAVRDVRVREGRLEDLFREVTRGVAA